MHSTVNVNPESTKVSTVHKKDTFTKRRKAYLRRKEKQKSENTSPATIISLPLMNVSHRHYRRCCQSNIWETEHQRRSTGEHKGEQLVHRDQEHAARIKSR